jgi:hypothetical protein
MQRHLFAAGLVGAAIIALAPSAMAAGGIDGTGTVGTCPTAGSIAIKPALVTGGTSPNALSVKTKTPKGSACSGGTGDGANVISAASKGGGTGTTNDCATLVGSQPSNLSLTIKWKTAKGTSKLNPSTISITTQTGSISTTPANHGQFDVTGTVTAGSFSGANVSATIVTDQDVAEIGTACGGKGLKKITFGSKPSKDDSQIGSGSTTIN